MYSKLVSIPAILFLAALASASLALAQVGSPGAVYTMTNSAQGNEVLEFERLADGALRFAAAYPTEGLGSGDGLGNQGGIVLSDDGRWLLVVNAGSDEISVFAVGSSGLILAGKAPSGGVRPISVAVHKKLVYVVHAGGGVGSTDSIQGFTLDSTGELSELPASERDLSAPATGPAQIGFSPDGRFVLVTEKATSRIDVFLLDAEGYATGPIAHPSAGQTPFAFAFGKRGQLFVSEVFGGAPDAGAVSSYVLDDSGQLGIVDASVPNTETAPCWLVATKGGRFIFTTNTPDDSLSAYAVGFDGHLDLVDDDGRTGEPGAGTRPLDMDLSDDGRFLYTLNIGNGTISTFRVMPDGSLAQTHVVDGLPGGVNGLAAR